MNKKTLLPWTICGVHQPSQTFKTFFEEEVREKLHSSVVLQEAFAKEKLDSVTLDLLICDVVSVFGAYLKYVVREAEAIQEPVCESEYTAC